ncbi:MAG: Ig-like domain-containing protein, partial [Planctomycetes bacterium]|nr:Ig-like domain-containing protein [Planctomycetota bacterium]
MLHRLRAIVSLTSVALLAMVGFSGCDNPACVFSTEGCNASGSGGTGVGTASASLPVDGNIVFGSLPTLELALPSGGGIWPGSPVVLRFSESMNPESLAGAFLVQDRFSGQPYPVVSPPAILGDGRVVVLQPITALDDGRNYDVVVAPGAVVTDVTGQEWGGDPGDVVASFSTDERVHPLPQVLLTYPEDGDTEVSDLTEIGVVFDRAMNPVTFGADSMFVKVGGADPSPNPTATAATAGPAPLPSAWTWASSDVFGSRVSLGAGNTVTLTLSPAGHSLLDTEDGALATTTATFTLAGLPAPVAGTKPFGAADAIGSSDLLDLITPVLEVELSQPTVNGDEMYVYLFGEDPVDGEVVAYERRIPLAPGLSLVGLLSSDLELLDGVGAGLVQDGSLRVAVRMGNGLAQSALRILDGSPFESGVQDYLLDLTAPEVVTMGFSPMPTGILITDQRDLTVFGVASEVLAGARVSTAFGDNVTSLDPPAPAQMGLGDVFVAASAPLGIVDPSAGPIGFSLEVFDNALNASIAAFSGTWTQVGVASTGNLLPGAQIQVWAYDAETLLPIEGARVITHRDDGGITFLEAGDTNLLGTVSLQAGATGETLVTVDADGYDLFTFHGAPRAMMQVLLDPITPTAATWQGQVQASFPEAPIQGVDVLVSDTRLNLDGILARRAAACTLDTAANLYRCAFGTEVGRIGRVGFGTFIAGDLGLVQA